MGKAKSPKTMTGRKMGGPAKRNLTAKKAARLRLIEGLMAQEFSAPNIFQVIKDQYNIAYGTLRNDMVLIRQSWQSNFSDSALFEVGGYGPECYHRLCVLQRKATAKGDIATAVKIEELKAGMRGVDIKSPIQRTQDVPLSEISDTDQIDREIARLNGIMGGGIDK